MKLSEATVLVVDDEPALREIFAKWLVAMGCGRVLVAADGLLALGVLKSELVDLLVTDVRMPVMDGVTLVRRLTAMEIALPSVVFISGFGDVDKREMYGLGVEAFVSKPFDRNELLGVLERALAERTCLWLTPMLLAPRQTMLVKREDAALASVHLGRGGFSVCYDGLLSLSKVAFVCCLPKDGPHPAEREMRGQGYVRWISRKDRSVGVEFVYVEEVCRDWVVQEIADIRPMGFIPDSRDTASILIEEHGAI